MPTWAERIANAAAAEAVSRCKGKGKAAGKDPGRLGSGRGGKGSDSCRGKGAAAKGSSNKGCGKGLDQSPKQSPGENRWWRCSVKKCIDFCGGKACWNRPMATECKICMQPKSTAAASAAADNQQALAQLRKDVAAKPGPVKPKVNANELADMLESSRLECLRDMANGHHTGLSKGAEKRLKAEATEKELIDAGLPVPAYKQTAGAASPAGGAAAGKPSNDEDASQPMEEEKPDAAIAASLKRLGLTRAEPVEPGKLYALPDPPQPCSLEQAVKKALAGDQSEAVRVKQTLVAKLLASTESLKNLGEEDELYKQSEKRLESESALLKTMQDKAPAACSQEATERLKKAKQDWKVLVTTAGQRRATNKQKAQERHTRDLAAVDDQIKALTELRASLVKSFKAADDAFEMVRKDRITLDEAIEKEIDAKIKASTPIRGNEAPPAGGQGADGPGQAAPGERVSASATTAMYEDLLLRADDIVQEDLPTINVADATEQEKAVLESMWAYFQAMSKAPLGSPKPPTTFLQLGAANVGIASILVGQKVWRGFYGEARCVEPNAFVPWQLLEMLQLALEKAKSQLTTSKTEQEAAAASYELAKANARNNCYCPW